MSGGYKVLPTSEDVLTGPQRELLAAVKAKRTEITRHESWGRVLDDDLAVLVLRLQEGGLRQVRVARLLSLTPARVSGLTDRGAAVRDLRRLEGR